MAYGSVCWNWRNSARGSSWGWRSSTAPRSALTRKPLVRQKGGSSAQRDQREALGRSRGGFSTKASVIVDGSGRAIGFALAPGQANELPMAPVLLSFLTAVALWIVADRGYSSQAFRMLIWSLGARPAIPTRRNEAPVACPPWIYQNRNRVERFWSRVTEWRAVATRYEKTERSFMGVLCMAATIDWLRA
jgi:transposase